MSNVIQFPRKPKPEWPDLDEPVGEPESTDPPPVHVYVHYDEYTPSPPRRGWFWFIVGFLFGMS